MSITILITGHRGYIGSAVFKLLLEVIEIERIIGYDLIEGDDILDYNRLLSQMKVHKPDMVIHLAAITSKISCNADPGLAMRVNGAGTCNVLKAMKEVGCKHIIYASTSEVYGNVKKLPCRENHRPCPESIYGTSKLLGEFALQNHYDFQGNEGNYAICRLFNVVGTSGYRDVDSINSPTYDRLFPTLETGYVTIYGTDYSTYDGTCERDYIALKDVCEGLAAATAVVFNNCRFREIINICTGELTSVRSVIDIWNNMSEKIFNSHRPDLNNLPYIHYNIGHQRRGDVSKICGSNDKAIELLDWKPTKKIENIIYDYARDKNGQLQ
jgi:UDP-glucose 4-epimerase